ncbi:hypothetical protein [Corynebacterium doosanense]|nr:hypothetical protein [Corynebacterium doosanense]
MSTIPSHDNEPQKSPKPWYKRWWGIALIVLVAFFLFGGILNALGFEGDTTDTAAGEQTTTNAPEESTSATEQPSSDPATSASPEPESTTSEAPASSERPTPAAAVRHERCVDDDGTAEMVTGILNDPGMTIKNPQLIKDGNDTWIGAGLVDGTGRDESRSDVWLLRDGTLYAVSGGARNNSSAAQAAGVSMADDLPAGVDRCVVAESMGF